MLIGIWPPSTYLLVYCITIIITGNLFACKLVYFVTITRFRFPMAAFHIEKPVRKFWDRLVYQSSV